jgi:multisubunit Na+/H+ antiporter MnhB subunit
VPTAQRTFGMIRTKPAIPVRRKPDGTFEMLALTYVFIICAVAAVLFLIVDDFEPNRRLASVLKFLVLVLGAAAVARQLLP